MKIHIGTPMFILGILIAIASFGRLLPLALGTIVAAASLVSMDWFPEMTGEIER